MYEATACGVLGEISSPSHTVTANRPKAVEEDGDLHIMDKSVLFYKLYGI